MMTYKKMITTEEDSISTESAIEKTQEKRGIIVAVNSENGEINILTVSCIGGDLICYQVLWYFLALGTAFPEIRHREEFDNMGLAEGVRHFWEHAAEMYFVSTTRELRDLLNDGVEEGGGK